MAYVAKSKQGGFARKKSFSPKRSFNTSDRRESSSSNVNYNRTNSSSRPSYNRSDSSNRSSYNRSESSQYRSSSNTSVRGNDRSKYGGNNFSAERRTSGFGSNNFRNSNNSRSSFGGRSRNFGNSRSRFGNRRSNRPQLKTISRNLYINDLQSEVAAEKSAYEGKSYADFELNRRLLQNIQAKGYKTTTEIQEKAIPMILAGEDVLGISATGSGKTGAFLIPLIQKLLDDSSQKLLVVAPTRELALQISKEAMSFIKNTHIQISLIVGGESMGRQISQLRRGGHIVVGTPGRLMDLIKREKIAPSQYNNIVIDEVDRMLDMGFIEDIEFIFENLPSKRQAQFFSATLNKKVERIVGTLSKSFDIIKLSNNTPTKSVVQSVIDYSHSEEKIDKLQNILNQEEVEKAIIFVDTKRYADQVDKILYGNKYKVGVIHGDKRQNSRKRVIENFKSSRINVLVATNVAARGIDIDDITHVINLDEPQTYDEYIHRIGRTGRNGSFGTAYTFVRR